MLRQIRIGLRYVNPVIPCRLQISEVDPHINMGSHADSLRHRTDHAAGRAPGLVRCLLSGIDGVCFGAQAPNLLPQIRDPTGVEALDPSANGTVAVAVLRVNLDRSLQQFSKPQGAIRITPL